MEKQQFVVIAKLGEVWKHFSDPIEDYEVAVKARDRLAKKEPGTQFSVLALPLDPFPGSVPVVYLHPEDIRSAGFDPDQYNVAQVAHDMAESDGFMNAFWVTLKEVMEWQ